MRFYFQLTQICGSPRMAHSIPVVQIVPTSRLLGILRNNNPKLLLCSTGLMIYITHTHYRL